jgi:uncharacterized membrane protein
MSRTAKAITAALAIALGVHVSVVWAIPRVAMRFVMSEGAKIAGTNQLSHPAMATADVRDVPRPCPDFAYSFAVLDLSEGPVRLRIPLTPPYTSAALFSMETDNFFVRNDRDAQGKPLDVIVLAPGTDQPTAPPADVSVVQAPSDRAFLLVRRVVESKNELEAVDAIRRQATCAPYREGP